MTDTNQDYLENAKLLYEVSKYEYESELSRSSRLDEKVNKILTFESVIIVAFTTLVTNSSIIEFLNQKIFFNFYLSYGLAITFFVIISISLYILIQCLALRNIEKLHVDQSMSLRIGKLDVVSAYIEVVKNYSEITIRNQKSNDAKAEKLFKNHNLLFLALLIIALYMSSLFIAFVTPNKDSKELTKDSNSNNLVTELIFLNFIEKK